MIDVSNVDSLPKELEDCIMDYFSNMTQENISKIKKHEIRYSSDVGCAIKDYLSPDKAITLYHNIITILDNFDLVLYHATRILNRAVIEKNGLRVNDWPRYSKSLANVFKTLGINKEDIKKILKCIESEYKRKYSSENAILCFFSGLNLLNREHDSYEQFCETIGGELANWALENEDPKWHNLLKENGEAVIVKFKLPFTNIDPDFKKTIVYLIICYYAAKFFFDYKYQIEFDGMTSHDISPSDILEILPYSKEM